MGGHPFAAVTKPTCHGSARGGLGCRAAAVGTGGRAGRPRVLHQPHATSKGTRHTRVASGRPMALPAPRAALSLLSPVATRTAVPPCQRVQWLCDSGAGWPGRALQLPPSPLLLHFINNAAPRCVGSAAHTPAALAWRRVLRGRTAGAVTPWCHAMPVERRRTPGVPAPHCSLCHSPAPRAQGGWRWAVTGARGDPTCGDVPTPGGGGAGGGAQLAWLPWRCAGANEPE